jgi:P-type conjugative transfer protein TrbJ
MRNGIIATLTICILLLEQPPRAPAGAFATEFTQLLNHGQMVMSYIRQGTQLSNELSMYAEQIRNGLALPSHIYGTINSDLTALSSIVQGGQALAYSLANLDTQFRNTFTGYGTSPNRYFANYKGWATTALDTLQGTLRAAGLQGSQLASEQAVLNTLRSQAQSPNGTVGAIQVMGDIAEQQTEQLMKLRQIMLADLSSKQAYQGAQLQKEAATTAATEQFFTPSNTTGDNRRFGAGNH